MITESVELKNYRNYKELHMEFNQGTNMLYGDNARGETNILEAVYACCTSKSRESTKDRDIIRFDQDKSHIKLQIRKSSVPCRIDMHLKRNKPKGTAANGVPIRKASKLFGIANVVSLPPEDLNVIKDGPSKRRRFIDMELYQLNRFYVRPLVQYNKTLLQHNKLLKELFLRPEYEEALNIWDAQLMNYGREMIKFRRGSTKQLNEIIHAIHLSLTGGKEDIITSYEPYTPQDQMEDVLKKNRVQDMKQRTTLSGPHRDDINSIVSGIDIRRFGSQGQQCTAALSLKLSELELVKQLSHSDPILLSDDVLPELDNSRQNHLSLAIKHIQTMITRTGLDDFANNRLQVDKVFKVVDGTVVNEN